MDDFHRLGRLHPGPHTSTGKFVWYVKLFALSAQPVGSAVPPSR